MCIWVMMRGKFLHQVPSGEMNERGTSESFVTTPYHDQLLADMVQSHMVKDFCVIGSRVSQTLSGLN